MSGRIQRFTRGQQISSARPQLNQLVDAANRARGPAGPAGTAPGFVPQRIISVQIRNLDTPAAGQLECTIDSFSLNPSLLVYVVNPPWTLTEASRAGVSYVYTDINNRTADGTEVQKLTPEYILNDWLMIAEYEQGGIWRDLNIDGRQWAKVP